MSTYDRRGFGPEVCGPSLPDPSSAAARGTSRGGSPPKCSPLAIRPRSEARAGSACSRWASSATATRAAWSTCQAREETA